MASRGPITLNGSNHASEEEMAGHDPHRKRRNMYRAGTSMSQHADAERLELLGEPARPATSLGMVGLASGLSESASEDEEEGGGEVREKFKERRWVDIEVVEARCLPAMDDDEGGGPPPDKKSTLGACDPYVRMTAGGKSVCSKVQIKTQNPRWGESHSLGLKLGVEKELVVRLMDWDADAHDSIGTVTFTLGHHADALPDRSDRLVRPLVSVGGTRTATSVEGWFSVIGENRKPVRSAAGKAEVCLKVTHWHELRDLAFRPTAMFEEACVKRPDRRSRRDVMLMVEEMVRGFPAATQMGAAMLKTLVSTAEAKQYALGDCVSKQTENGNDDSLHFVVKGQVDLHAQERRANLAMYKVLKGRSFASLSSFGPLLSHRGPGEAFGEGSVLVHPCESFTAVCSSGQALILRVDRRACELVMEHLRRRVLGYSPKVVHTILTAPPKDRVPSDETWISSYASQLPCFRGLTDATMLAITRASSLRQLELGEVIHGTECHRRFHVLMSGSASLHAGEKSSMITHTVPVSGECSMVIGAGESFGGYGVCSMSLVARESTDVLVVSRDALLNALRGDEALERQRMVGEGEDVLSVAAKQRSMHESDKGGGGGGAKRPLVEPFGSIFEVCNSLTLAESFSGCSGSDLWRLAGEGVSIALPAGWSGQLSNHEYSCMIVEGHVAYSDSVKSGGRKKLEPEAEKPHQGQGRRGSITKQFATTQFHRRPSVSHDDPSVPGSPISSSPSRSPKKTPRNSSGMASQSPDERRLSTLEYSALLPPTEGPPGSDSHVSPSISLKSATHFPNTNTTPPASPPPTRGSGGGNSRRGDSRGGRGSTNESVRDYEVADALGTISRAASSTGSVKGGTSPLQNSHDPNGGQDVAMIGRRRKGKAKVEIVYEGSVKKGMMIEGEGVEYQAVEKTLVVIWEVADFRRTLGDVWGVRLFDNEKSDSFDGFLSLGDGGGAGPQLSGGTMQEPDELPTFMRCQMLRGVPILSVLPASLLETLSVNMQECLYPTGAVVVSDGDADEAIYIVREGVVCLHEAVDRDHHALLASSFEGCDSLLDTSVGRRTWVLSNMDVFGQCEFVLRFTSSFTAVCSTPVRLLRIEARDMVPEVESLLGMHLSKLEMFDLAIKETPADVGEGEAPRTGSGVWRQQSQHTMNALLRADSEYKMKQDTFRRKSSSEAGRTASGMDEMVRRKPSGNGLIGLSTSGPSLPAHSEHAVIGASRESSDVGFGTGAQLSSGAGTIDPSRAALEIEWLSKYSVGRKRSIAEGLTVKYALIMCRRLVQCVVPESLCVALRTPEASFVAEVLSGTLDLKAFNGGFVGGAAGGTLGEPLVGEDVGDRGEQMRGVLRVGDIVHGHSVHKDLVETQPHMADATMAAVCPGPEAARLVCVENQWHRMVTKRSGLAKARKSRTFLSGHEVFKDLPGIGFDKLSRSTKIRRCNKGDIVFHSKDDDGSLLRILVSGEFHLTSGEGAGEIPLAVLGPGRCFGREGGGRKGVNVAVVCSVAGSAYAEVGWNQLGVILPSEPLSWLKQQALADWEDARHRPSTRIGKPQLSRPAAAQEMLREKGGRGEGEKGMQTKRGEDGEVVRVVEEAYQTGFVSGGMMQILEKISKGKALAFPLPHEDDPRKNGFPPEVVLPSLRKQNKELRLSALDYQPLPAPANLRLQDPDKSKGGMRKKIDEKLDAYRKSADRRAYLAKKVVKHKMDIVVSRHGQDFVAENKVKIVDASIEAEAQAQKQKRREEIVEKMEVQNKINEQKSLQKMHETEVAIHRKEANDKRLVERVEAARMHAKHVKMMAGWLMVVAIGERMQAWTSAFTHIRAVRADFTLWVAAAITIQRYFRKHARGLSKKERELAANVIIRYFRIWWIDVKIRRKAAAQKVLLEFFRASTHHSHGVQFKVNLFLYRVRRIQRFWRDSSQTLKRVQNKILTRWGPAEQQWREKRKQLHAKREREKEKAIKEKKPVKKEGNITLTNPAIFSIKYRVIRDELRDAKKHHIERKAGWLQSWHDWQTRERYRLMVMREKQLMYQQAAGGGAAPAQEEHDDLVKLSYVDCLYDHVDPKDPVPRFPVFDPSPSDEKLIQLIERASQLMLKVGTSHKMPATPTTPKGVGMAPLINKGKLQSQVSAAPARKR